MNIISRVFCRVFQFGFRVALPVLPYREPKIVGGMDNLAELFVQKKVSKVLVVTDKGIVGAGLLNNLLAELEKKHVESIVFDETVPNPTITNVEDAKNMYLTNSCQAIIGFGGGSSMDCAKVTAARIAKPNQPVHKMKGLLKICKKLPMLVAVPTTAGTGSETTLAAVITDDKTHHKYPINDFSLIPEYAVLDYRVTLELPKHLTSTTGMDALTHAVEAYIGGTTTRHTRAMAEEAVMLINKYLKAAYDNGSDEEARRQMLRAAYCAGVAFTQSYVGYVHGIAHSLGGQYKTPHGLANAVILPHMLKQYGEKCYKRLGLLAKKSGIVDGAESNSEAAVKFIAWIEEINAYMEIPKYLDCIEEKDIPEMAKKAASESNPLYPVPVLYDSKELEEIYRNVSTKLHL